MKSIRTLVLILLVIPLFLFADEPASQKYKWNLSDIYKTNDEFLEARQSVDRKLSEIDGFKGKLGESSTVLKRCLDLVFGMYQEYSSLDSFTGMTYDENLKNLKAQKDKGEIAQLGVTVREKTAWLVPEIQSLGKERVENYLQQDKGLAIYDHYLTDALRVAQHTLSVPEEALLSRSTMMASAPYDVYSAYTNSDMDYPAVKLSDGAEVQLNAAGYSRYRSVDNREDRKKVFDSFWDAHKKYENTFGVLLNAQIGRDWFYGKSRKYDSSVAAALDSNNIPVNVYTQLVSDINQNVSSMYRYLNLRKKMLGVEKLAYYDMYPSIVKDVAMSYPYDQSTQLVLEAMKPLGNEYQQTLQQAFQNRWIDVYPTEGKRSGAYSNGGVYSLHPYVLLNHNDDYESLSTVAHELGHTMHSYFSNKSQPYPTADTTIFVAEVASTFNEILLNEYLISKEQDPNKKLFLLGNQLERFRQTVFRQAMFAEFEYETHKRVENGETLTGADFTKFYLELLRKYHGHDQGVCEIDERYGIEWSYIPHFYYNFYVYQYATGMVASTALAEKVMAGEKGAVDRYLTFLRSGGSRYPIDLLKSAGADMTTPEPFALAMKSFNRTMDRIETILKEMGSK
jgi:oligoendopeptidase F